MFVFSQPSIVLVGLIANRYLLLLAYISASDSARPVYSTMHRPLPIGSAVKSPRPVRERLTTSAYSPVANFRFAIRIFLSPDSTFPSHAECQHLAPRAISRKQNRYGSKAMSHIGEVLPDCRKITSGWNALQSVKSRPITARDFTAMGDKQPKVGQGA